LAWSLSPECSGRMLGTVRHITPGGYHLLKHESPP
jgi:hypothetical protein